MVEATRNQYSLVNTVKGNVFIILKDNSNIPNNSPMQQL